MTSDIERPTDRAVCHVLMVSLGCPKNLVDSESMCRILTDAGRILVDRPEEADAIIVNTCGFIESAKREAIDTLLEMAKFKQPPYSCRFLVAAGCLAQRYSGDIRRDMPEVDAVIGTSHYEDVARVLDELTGGTTGIALCGEPGSLVHLRKERLVSTMGYAYLKIAEGCTNRCSYCSIPGIRGPYQSRAPEDILEEAAALAAQGIREIILIAQDTTRYGTDLHKGGHPVTLAGLLRMLETLPGIERIRLMYCYLDGITDDLIDCIASSTRIARYLDVPVQHLSDRILARMNRRDTAESIRSKIAMLRTRIPGIVLRSTVMVGFPGETAQDFETLVQALVEIRFDRLGCFMFSSEEGTPAADLRPSVRRDVSGRRFDRIMALQQEISLQSNLARIGSIVMVSLDSITEDGLFYCGRSEGEAPDIDPVIQVALSDADPGIGAMVSVRIVAATEYDMTGVTV